MRLLWVGLLSLGILTAGYTRDLAVMLGYDGTSWRVVFYDGTEEKTRSVTLEEEPHGFDYDFRSHRLLYSDAMGQVHIRDLSVKRERLLALPKENGYIQPVFSCQEGWVYLVELPKHSSRAARIVRVGLENGTKEIVVEQNSAQLEPMEVQDGRHLLFTSLSCNHGCGKLIQEIWWKDLISGESDQLTLLNAFNSHPVSKEGKLYFVSNRGGAYHIWKQRLKEKGGAAVQLTHGDTTDTSPAPLQNGALLFIRHKNGRDHLILKTLSGGEKELPLERKYFKLRQLKVNRCKN